MISPTCDYCDEELKEFGGILLSPPDEHDMVRKYHICIECYKLIRPKEENE